jgi:hypothetical protein
MLTLFWMNGLKKRSFPQAVDQISQKSPKEKNLKIIFAPYFN